MEEVGKKLYYDELTWKEAEAQTGKSKTTLRRLMRKYRDDNNLPPKKRSYCRKNLNLSSEVLESLSADDCVREIMQIHVTLERYAMGYSVVRGSEKQYLLAKTDGLEIGYRRSELPLRKSLLMEYNADTIRSNGIDTVGMMSEIHRKTFLEPYTSLSISLLDQWLAYDTAFDRKCGDLEDEGLLTVYNSAVNVRTTIENYIVTEALPSVFNGYMRYLEYRIISTLSRRYPVQCLCGYMGVNPVSYYRWEKKAESQNGTVPMIVLFAYLHFTHSSNPSWGIGRLNKRIQELSGIIISQKAMRTWCKYLNINGTKGRKQFSLKSHMEIDDIDFNLGKIAYRVNRNSSNDLTIK